MISPGQVMLHLNRLILVIWVLMIKVFTSCNFGQLFKFGCVLGFLNFFIICDRYLIVIFGFAEIKKGGAQSLNADDEIAEELRRANDLLEDVSCNICI